MNLRESVSPSPVPSAFLSAVPTCRNSSKTVSRSPGAIPVPVYAHLAVEDQGGGAERGDRGHQRGEALGVVPPGPAHESDLPLVLVGDHPPPVILLFPDPAGSVEGLGHERGLHQGHGGERGPGHALQYNGA
jgi:hypothetical protein